MILRRLFFMLVLMGAGAAIAAPKASTSQKSSTAADAALLAAYDAFRADDPIKLQKASAQARGHILAPYLEYWRVRLRLGDAALHAAGRAFLEREPRTYLPGPLRREGVKGHRPPAHV